MLYFLPLFIYILWNKFLLKHWAAFLSQNFTEKFSNLQTIFFNTTVHQLDSPWHNLYTMIHDFFYGQKKKWLTLYFYSHFRRSTNYK